MSGWLDPALTTLALCWRLDRDDGVALGFTAHDRDLTLGGLRYRATPGMMPSAISLSDGFEVATLDVAGALTSDAIREADLLAGRWDGAQVRLFAADWTAPEVGPVALAEGELGDVTLKDGAFSAELRGSAALLERPVVEQTSPDCRAALGDRRCGVDLAERTRLVRVVSMVDAATVLLDEDEPGANLYGYGTLTWLGGANCGLRGAILSSTGSAVALREPPAFVVEAGTLVRLVEGCDRTFATCRARFRNAVNFRGEPHLPGNDLLTRYPGG